MTTIKISTETKALLIKVCQSKEQNPNKVLHNLLKAEVEFIKEREKLYNE